MRKARLFAVMLLVIALLATSAFAAGSNFVPSIEQNGAPDIEATSEGDAVQIIVTPYSEKDNPDTDDPEVAARITSGLEQAYNDIQAAATLGDLKSDNGTIQADLESAIEGTGYTVEDLVVTDLFDVTEVGEVPGTITLAIATVGDVLAVLHSPAPGVWEVVEFTVDGDKIIINVDGLSPFALVAANPDSSGSEPEKPEQPGESGSTPVTSPQTGETANSTVLVVATLLLTAAAACAVRAKRYAQ